MEVGLEGARSQCNCSPGAIAANPDRTIDRRLTTCPKCNAALPEASQTPQQGYECIELPPARSDVTQIRLFGGRCACCGERVTADAPPNLEQSSPFGPSIAAMVVYLHYAHAIGMERLALLMNELFALSISECAICNILARARQPLLDATVAIEKAVLASPVVCSDETSVQVKGKNWWEWVFVTTAAVLHTTQLPQGGGDRAVRPDPARGLGFGHAGQPARPRRALAGMPGAPAPGREICHRMWGYRVQRAVSVAVATRHRDRTAARAAEGRHPEAVSL
jgi:transposase